MNKRITVELDWDTIDGITTCSMKSLVESLQDDLEKRKAGTGIAVFHNDKKKDVAEIKKHIDAFKIILKYYGKDNEQ